MNYWYYCCYWYYCYCLNYWYLVWNWKKSYFPDLQVLRQKSLLHGKRHLPDQLPVQEQHFPGLQVPKRLPMPVPGSALSFYLYDSYFSPEKGDVACLTSPIIRMSSRIPGEHLILCLRNPSYQPGPSVRPATKVSELDVVPDGFARCV